MKEIWIGILSSLFFAVTFILNRSMELSGGSWLRSSSLLYFFMVPFLIAIVAYHKGFTPMKKEIKNKPILFSFGVLSRSSFLRPSLHMPRLTVLGGCLQAHGN